MKGCEGGDARRMESARPGLKKLVREASHALALLDLARLEELAVCCQKLTMVPVNADEAREAVAEMAVLGRVLEATRSNVDVMRRLRLLHAERVEYSERQIRGDVAESEHGHD